MTSEAADIMVGSRNRSRIYTAVNEHCGFGGFVAAEMRKEITEKAADISNAADRSEVYAGTKLHALGDISIAQESAGVPAFGGYICCVQALFKMQGNIERCPVSGTLASVLSVFSDKSAQSGVGFHFTAVDAGSKGYRACQIAFLQVCFSEETAAIRIVGRDYSEVLTLIKSQVQVLSAAGSVTPTMRRPVPHRTHCLCSRILSGIPFLL